MTAWWYVEKDQKIGPIEQGDLTRLIHGGKIGSKTMLWKEGMPSWLPLDEIEELRALKAAVPPPLSTPVAARLPRFFARFFDLSLETLIVSLVLGVVLNQYFASFGELINNQLFLALCVTPISLIVDAVIYQIFGNTPGKAMLGLKVEQLDSSPLSFGQYLGRNFSMWVSGLALGFPLFSFFTMLHQATRLGMGKQASYDERGGYRVHAKPIGWGRIFVLFVFAIFYGLYLSSWFLSAAQR